MAKGSCLCGAVAFEFDDADVVTTVGCYCTNCRKVSGSQYGVYLQVRTRGFRWMSGQDRLVAYESSPGNHRAFCGTCGAVAPSATPYGAVRVPGGALDDDPGVPPDVLIYCGSKAEWCTADRASRTFVDAGPAEFWGAVVQKLYAGG
jgi:hypothetical protein